MATGLNAQAAGDRQTPHSYEAEQATLGSVLIKPAAIGDVAEVLSVDDFFFPAHREVFESMLGLVANGEPIDVVPLYEDLRRRGKLSMLDGQESYLFTLTGAVGTAENVGHYSGIVKERSIARRLIAKCLETASRAYALEDVGDLLTDHMADVGRIESGGDRDDDPVRMGDEIEHVLDVVERQAANPEQFFVRTGVSAYNRKIGGNRRGHLIVVAALPGDGKTSWMFDVALWSSEKQGVPNLVFSMEMPRQELAERGLGIFSLVETRKIHRGALALDDWKQLRPAANRIKPLPLFVADKRLTWEQIESKAHRWAAKVRRDLPPAPDGLPALLNISIDYLQIAKRSRHKGQSDESVIAEFTAACKGLAKDLKCPVTLLSQLTKQGHEKDFDGARKKPEKKDLKGSGAIEADADVIVMPFHEAEMPDDRHTGHKLMRSMLIVEKCRGGATGEIPCIYNKSIMSFQDDLAAGDFDSSIAGDSRLPRET